jgi:hypothetical protein
VRTASRSTSCLATPATGTVSNSVGNQLPPDHICSEQRQRQQQPQQQGRFGAVSTAAAASSSSRSRGSRSSSSSAVPHRPEASFAGTGSASLHTLTFAASKLTVPSQAAQPCLAGHPAGTAKEAPTRKPRWSQTLRVDRSLLQCPSQSRRSCQGCQSGRSQCGCCTRQFRRKWLCLSSSRRQPWLLNQEAGGSLPGGSTGGGGGKRAALAGALLCSLFWCCFQSVQHWSVCDELPWLLLV